MTRRSLTLAAIVLLALPSAGCDRKKPLPDPVVKDAPGPASVNPPSSAPSSQPAADVAAPAATPPDTGALAERKDPDRLLRFYAEALRSRDWAAAAQAWGKGSGVTAQTLKASYDRAEPPLLDIGRGEIEGAAGSLYYEAPVSLRFGPGAAPEQGSLVLRRANDVPGATAEQLRWHIERSTIGQGA
jgi:hypothetical protein